MNAATAIVTKHVEATEREQERCRATLAASGLGSGGVPVAPSGPRRVHPRLPRGCPDLTRPHEEPNVTLRNDVEDHLRCGLVWCPSRSQGAGKA